MIGNLARITEATRDSLHRDPASITALLYPVVASAAPKKKTGFWGRMFGCREMSETAPRSGLPPNDAMDLDKAWHGLHFLFTGSDWEGDFPAGFLVTGGKSVGKVDVGYGPARSFSSEEVRKIAAFLQEMDEGTLRSRLDPKVMEELDIYPSIWSSGTNLEEEWEYLSDGLRRLKAFVVEASQRDMALLVYIN